jgi:hypothetical protein
MIEILTDNVVTFYKTGYLPMPLFGVIFTWAAWAVIIMAFATKYKSKYPKIS